MAQELADHRTSPVDQFFQFSLLGLLAAGYLAVVGSGYLDGATILVTAAALMLRALQVAGLPQLRVSPSIVTILTLVYFAFYPIDYFYVSRSFIPATIHLVFFVAVVKILTASTERDYLYLKIIAFLELLAACILSSSLNFFVFLMMFLLLSVAMFASSEIRKSAQRRPLTAKVSERALGYRLTGLVCLVSLSILVITSALFIFLPRTARAAFQHFVSHKYHLAGFSGEVNLTQTGEIQREDTPVMRVRMDYPEDRRLPLKWRGMSLAEFNGRRWFNSYDRGETLQPDESGQIALSQQDAKERHISYAVHLIDGDTDALFFAGTPLFLRIDTPVVRYAVDNLRARTPNPAGLQYQVFSRLDPLNTESFAGDLTPLTPKQQQIYLKLPPSLDERIPGLARQITLLERRPGDQARALEHYLRTHYAYTLELPQTELADPLAYFLFDRKKGHCEYFASALAVMLRGIGVPARVVTGFQSGIYNPVSGWQIIRSSDAHSWVEAYLPYQGWTTFDPTPPDPNPPKLSLWTKMNFYIDAAEIFWQDWVVNYNLDRQLQIATNIESRSRHVSANWLEQLTRISRAIQGVSFSDVRRIVIPLLVILVLGALAHQFGSQAWAWWLSLRPVKKARRGEASASDATLLYERMLRALKRRGIEKPPWLTPMEFARVLPEADLSLLVEDFTGAYNALRFGGNADAAGRIVRILSQLETR
ncbi:MAG TPA: DUF3488 and transglutaminase-like domain-containing protein [Bryobacteraceae bacterium]|nr:DUF3488 and transglutaminase-like domain-containing protein [Bryobacteraceae bacterium]